MVGIRVLSSRDVAIIAPIPKPVIIFANMRIADWKNFFIQEKEKTSDPVIKTSYDRCIKIIMWAEFCDGTLTKVGNYKNENGMNIQFFFSFPTLAVCAHFHRNIQKNLEAITDPTKRNLTFV